MAKAKMRLCCDSPTALIKANWRGTAHCCNSNVRAGFVRTWNKTKRNLAINSVTKFSARPWRSRNGIWSSSDTITKRTGRNRENQAPKGMERTAGVTHQIPCKRPAWSGESRKSSRMKGRKTPKV